MKTIDLCPRRSCWLEKFNLRVNMAQMVEPEGGWSLFDNMSMNMTIIFISFYRIYPHYRHKLSNIFLTNIFLLIF